VAFMRTTFNRVGWAKKRFRFEKTVVKKIDQDLGAMTIVVRTLKEKSL